jgi:hypothetical protein
MTTAPASARQKLTFLALLAVLALATLAFTFWGPGGRDVAETQAVQGIDGGRTVPGDTGQMVVPSPPAYLAWISGGFAADFRARVRTLDAFTDTVVVAGDTRWMTRSTDADGTVVDDPPGAFAFPIDAFAVNPVEYAPFLSQDIRDDVIGALDRGQGVLSTRSAELRDIGVGGTMAFGDQDVTIGAVVPDEAIGWSELLVSRDVGGPLGIVDDRYLLALPTGQPGLDRFTEVLTPLVPEATAIRVEKPGDTPFMRVASGVNPPIVLKQVFGEFAAQPARRDPAQLTIQPAWVGSHIVTRSVPVLGRVTCNEAFFPALTRALREVERQGLGTLLQTYNGCWNARTVARSPTAPPSFHAYGAAIDINAAANAYGATPTMDERIVEIFERFGFMWGGDFLIPDGMHFEYGEPMEAA